MPVTAPTLLPVVTVVAEVTPAAGALTAAASYALREALLEKLSAPVAAAVLRGRNGVVVVLSATGAAAACAIEFAGDGAAGAAAAAARDLDGAVIAVASGARSVACRVAASVADAGVCIKGARLSGRDTLQLRGLPSRWFDVVVPTSDTGHAAADVASSELPLDDPLPRWLAAHVGAGVCAVEVARAGAYDGGGVLLSSAGAAAATAPAVTGAAARPGAPAWLQALGPSPLAAAAASSAPTLTFDALVRFADAGAAAAAARALVGRVITYPDAALVCRFTFGADERGFFSEKAVRARRAVRAAADRALAARRELMDAAAALSAALSARLEACRGLSASTSALLRDDAPPPAGATVAAGRVAGGARARPRRWSRPSVDSCGSGADDVLRSGWGDGGTDARGAAPAAPRARADGTTASPEWGECDVDGTRARGSASTSTSSSPHSGARNGGSGGSDDDGDDASAAPPLDPSSFHPGATLCAPRNWVDATAEVAAAAAADAEAAVAVAVRDASALAREPPVDTAAVDAAVAAATSTAATAAAALAASRFASIALRDAAGRAAMVARLGALGASTRAARAELRAADARVSRALRGPSSAPVGSSSATRDAELTSVLASALGGNGGGGDAGVGAAAATDATARQLADCRRHVCGSVFDRLAPAAATLTALESAVGAETAWVLGGGGGAPGGAAVAGPTPSTDVAPDRPHAGASGGGARGRKRARERSPIRTGGALRRAEAAAAAAADGAADGDSAPADALDAAPARPPAAMPAHSGPWATLLGQLDAEGHACAAEVAQGEAAAAAFGRWAARCAGVEAHAAALRARVRLDVSVTAGAATATAALRAARELEALTAELRRHGGVAQTAPAGSDGVAGASLGLVVALRAAACAAARPVVFARAVAVAAAEALILRADATQRHRAVATPASAQEALLDARGLETVSILLAAQLAGDDAAAAALADAHCAVAGVDVAAARMRAAELLAALSSPSAAVETSAAAASPRDAAANEVCAQLSDAAMGAVALVRAMLADGDALPRPDDAELAVHAPAALVALLETLWADTCAQGCGGGVVIGDSGAVDGSAATLVRASTAALWARLHDVRGRVALWRRAVALAADVSAACAAAVGAETSAATLRAARTSAATQTASSDGGASGDDDDGGTAAACAAARATLAAMLAAVEGVARAPTTGDAHEASRCLARAAARAASARGAVALAGDCRRVAATLRAQRVAVSAAAAAVDELAAAVRGSAARAAAAGDASALAELAHSASDEHALAGLLEQIAYLRVRAAAAGASAGAAAAAVLGAGQAPDASDEPRVDGGGGGGGGAAGAAEPASLRAARSAVAAAVAAVALVRDVAAVVRESCATLRDARSKRRAEALHAALRRARAAAAPQGR